MIPEYLQALNLSADPLDYEWNNEHFNGFWSAHDETSPRLAAAINSISSSAAFALGLACAEWVVARVDGHVETSDAQLRLEAAWAAELDPRYARLPPPPPNPPDAPKSFASPLRLAMKILAYAHELYSRGSLDLHARALGLALLADHVAGRHPAFSPWLSESLRRCHAISPDTGLGVEQEPRVAPELFTPDFDSQSGGEESLRRFVATLDPARNPYLVSAEELRLAGVSVPYGRSA